MYVYTYIYMLTHIWICVYISMHIFGVLDRKFLCCICVCAAARSRHSRLVIGEGGDMTTWPPPKYRATTTFPVLSFMTCWVRSTTRSNAYSKFVLLVAPAVGTAREIGCKEGRGSLSLSLSLSLSHSLSLSLSLSGGSPPFPGNPRDAHTRTHTHTGAHCPPHAHDIIHMLAHSCWHTKTQCAYFWVCISCVYVYMHTQTYTHKNACPCTLSRAHTRAHTHMRTQGIHTMQICTTNTAISYFICIYIYVYIYICIYMDLCTHYCHLDSMR